MVVSKAQMAASVYVRAIDATEDTIMHACGSDRTMDKVVEDYTSRGWTSVKKASNVVMEKTTVVVKKVKEKAPMVKFKTKTTQQVLDDLAQDEDLAAALRFVHDNPCIKVDVVEIKDIPPKDVNCDGKPPMVCVAVRNDAALKAGVCDVRHNPASMSMVSRMVLFVRKATDTPLVTVN